MAQDERGFKNLRVWQAGMDLVVQTYALTRKLPRHEQYELARQMRRAAVSVPSNIAEGHGRLHRADCVHFWSFSSGSLRELETQALILVRLEYVTAEEVAPYIALVIATQQMLSGLIRSKRE